MRIVAERHLRAYMTSHADSREAFAAWISETRAAKWMSPEGIKEKYSSASILEKNRVCFNIKGNTYRMIVAISYFKGIVLLKFIGTHAEYSKINANDVEMY